MKEIFPLPNVRLPHPPPAALESVNSSGDAVFPVTVYQLPASKLQRTLAQLYLKWGNRKPREAKLLLKTAQLAKANPGAQLFLNSQPAHVWTLSTAPVNSLRQGFRTQKQHKGVAKSNWPCPQPAMYWSVSVLSSLITQSVCNMASAELFCSCLLLVTSQVTWPVLVFSSRITYYHNKCTHTIALDLQRLNEMINFYSKLENKAQKLCGFLKLV